MSSSASSSSSSSSSSSASSGLTPQPTSTPMTRRPSLAVIVTEADSPLGHAIASRLLKETSAGSNLWAKVFALVHPQHNNNPLAKHLSTLGATLVPNNSLPHLRSAFHAARHGALVLVPPASYNMPQHVARILDLAKHAGSPVFLPSSSSPPKDARGVRSIVFVSDIAAQFPTLQVTLQEARHINKVAQVYKESEDLVLNLCKRGTAIVRPGIVMQDLLPLLEPGTLSTTLRFNSGTAQDAKFAPVNASDLAMGIHVLAHCLATGRPHPAFGSDPTRVTATTPSPKGKGKDKGQASTTPPPPTAAARVPHGRVFLFTSPTYESVHSIRDHVAHALTLPNLKSSSAIKSSEIPTAADLVHIQPNLDDTQLHAHVTATLLQLRRPGVRAFHTDKLVLHGALVRSGKLATARSTELERLLLVRPKVLRQVLVDHAHRFVPLALRVNAIAIGSDHVVQRGKQEDHGAVGEPLDVGGIAAAGTEE